jgi:GNAT superfamily N-acetyltransferase
MRTYFVKSDKDKKDFIELPKRLYCDDTNWVCPLDSEVEGIFNPLKNHAFQHGEAERWLLADDNNVVIGRVAAFIDEVRSKANRQSTGGMGFFEVIEDREAAFMLFDVVKQWLVDRGIQAMDGPINFGENDNNWGLLVEGFTQPGFGMPYHKRYYKAYFEEYGFKTYFEQYSYHKNIGVVDVFPERFMKIAEWISQRPGYSFEHFSYKKKDKYVNDLVTVYNSTWSVFKEDFTPLDPVLLKNTLEEAKVFMDEELIWYAYHDNKPVAFFVIFPDLNQIIKSFNGRLTIWNMIKFFWFKITHKMTRMRALVAGVDPSYQNSGIESAIFLKLFNVFRKKRYYKELELSWVGDFNPKMISIYEALGASKAKIHITYRYLINKNLPFITYKDEMAEKKRLRDSHVKS